VEEEIALLPWNLEADEAESCSWSEGLLAFAADERCSEFHKSPPALALLHETGTIGPYLRYRKWKEKDDNREETLEVVCYAGR
jgi:hypothetical protein